MPDETTTTTETTTETTDTTANEPKTFDAAYVEKLRQENAKHRVALNEFKSKTEAERKAIAKALGLGEDGTPDPAKLQETLAAKDAEVRQLKVEGRVRALAAKSMADAEALLDSRSFVAALADLDPAASDFETSLVAAIKSATDANPKLKVSLTATKGGTEIKNGTEKVTTFTRAQLRDPKFYAAHEKEILAAYADGLISQ